MVIIYLMYLSLGGVLILLTYLDLNIPRLSFFYWVKTSCIRIEFVPMRLDILFIWSIYTLKVCRSKPQTLVDIGQHFWYFIPRCFQIGQRSFKLYLMPCRPNQMDFLPNFSGYMQDHYAYKLWVSQISKLQLLFSISKNLYLNIISLFSLDTLLFMSNFFILEYFISHRYNIVDIVQQSYALAHHFSSWPEVIPRSLYTS